MRNPNIVIKIGLNGNLWFLHHLTETSYSVGDSYYFTPNVSNYLNIMSSMEGA